MTYIETLSTEARLTIASVLALVVVLMPLAITLYVRRGRPRTRHATTYYYQARPLNAWEKMLAWLKII